MLEPLVRVLQAIGIPDRAESTISGLRMDYIFLQEMLVMSSLVSQVKTRIFQLPIFFPPKIEGLVSVGFLCFTVRELNQALCF